MQSWIWTTSLTQLLLLTDCGFFHKLFEFDNIVVRIKLLWNKEIVNLQESRCSQMLMCAGILRVQIMVFVQSGTLLRRVSSMLNPEPKPSKNPNSLPIPVVDAPKRIERCRISSNTNKQVGPDMLPKFSSVSQLGCSFSFSTPTVSATTSRILYAPGCTTQNISLLSGFPTSFLPSDVSSPKCLAIRMGTVSFSSCWNKPASVSLPLSACSLSGTAICVDQYIS